MLPALSSADVATAGGDEVEIIFGLRPNRAELSAPLRRLAVLVSAMAIAETLLFSALAPLLPSFNTELGLSKAQVGLLVAMFPIGLGVAGLPIGLLASRVGVKQFAIVGLVMLAAAGVAFALADTYGELLTTRFLQGAAGALVWASALAWLVSAAPQRRGEMIGIFSGAAAAGQMLGPVVGGLAALLGRAGVFAGVAGFTLLLAVFGARFPGPGRDERPSLALIRKAHSSRHVVGALWLVAVPSLLFGTIYALSPLQLDRLGWKPVGIAGTFLAAAACGVVGRPLVGRWAERRGFVVALRLLLLACIPVTLVVPFVNRPWVLAVCVVLAIATYGVLFSPAMALASHAYEEAGVAQVFGFALIGLMFAAGFFLGSAAGGEIAHLAGDVTAYSLAAGTCTATVLALATVRRPA
jgi:MFS family permease